MVGEDIWSTDRERKAYIRNADRLSEPHYVQDG